MLCHESLYSYYTANSTLLFRRNHVFEQNLTLTELEEMTPFEREVYFIQIQSKINEHNNKNK